MKNIGICLKGMQQTGIKFMEFVTLFTTTVGMERRIIITSPIVLQDLYDKPICFHIPNAEGKKYTYMYT